MSVVWSEEAVRALGVRTDLVTAGSVLGIGRNRSYELAAAGEFPCRVIRAGSRYVIPTADLLRVLGLTEPGQPEPVDRSGAQTEADDAIVVTLRRA